MGKVACHTLLSALLATAVLLVALWTAGAFYYAQALYAIPAKSPTRDIPEEAKARLANCLFSLNNSLTLNPVDYENWYSRSKVIELGYAALPDSWKNHAWEFDLTRAIVRSPGTVSPVLRLALACAAGQRRLVPKANGCNGIFEAAIQRAPMYAYAHLRYAGYLYTEALSKPKQRQELAERVCQNYGFALSSLFASRLLKGWHQDRAYYDCPNLADRFTQMEPLNPISKEQWYLLGKGVARKGERFLNTNQASIIAYMQNQNASVADYEAFARGLAQFGLVKGGENILYSYLMGHEQDGKGWEAILRYLDNNRKALGKERMALALSLAVQRVVPEASSGLFLMDQARRLSRVDLVEAMFKRLVASFPDDPEIYLGMGRCQARLGRRAESVAYFRKAVLLDPNSPRLHIELGRAYVAIKQFNLAIDEFQKALDLSPDSKLAKEEMRRMGIYEN
ncbi:MAG: tetratricopeptide repeat protein [Desulfarculaceae bacterium]|nr:tetratricopeptide repeat protein [Desulfarculaceae bacterium]